jgi:hypothetical protein
VLGAKKCEELGMGMFLAVGKGSEQESKLIHMVYKPAKKPKKKIALIGKGVTFDSGGYSLKPSNAMEDMKVDMSGAAAVISAMDAIATLGSEHEIHAIAACCENLVSGRAYKLGDVLTSMDGTTVEINNTDAEGRLTLGDAITYARTKVEPDEMFDFATLTGACMVALGPYTAGVMSDHERLREGLARQRRDDGRGHVAPAAQPAPARAAQELGRRHAQHRRSLRRRDHRGAVPQDVRARTRPGSTSTSPARRRSPAVARTSRAAAPASRSRRSSSTPRRRCNAYWNE